MLTMDEQTKQAFPQGIYFHARGTGYLTKYNVALAHEAAEAFLSQPGKLEEIMAPGRDPRVTRLIKEAFG